MDSFNGIDEVWEDISLSFDVERVIDSPPFTKWAQNDKTKKFVKESIRNTKKDVFSFIEPRSVQKVLPKEKTRIEKYSPPQGLTNSNYLAIGVITIGDKIYDNPLRDKVESDDGRMNLDMLVTDALENIALSKLYRKVALEIKKIAEEKGFNTTRVIPPGSGSVDWGIENQEFIFDLIDSEKIGVKLKESNAISPQKSTSFVMGIGKKIDNMENIFSCKGCDRVECPYRSE